MCGLFCSRGFPFLGWIKGGGRKEEGWCLLASGGGGIADGLLSKLVSNAFFSSCPVNSNMNSLNARSSPIDQIKVHQCELITSLHAYISMRHWVQLYLRFVQNLLREIVYIQQMSKCRCHKHPLSETPDVVRATQTPFLIHSVTMPTRHTQKGRWRFFFLPSKL